MLFIAFPESYYIASDILKYLWMGIFYTKNFVFILIITPAAMQFQKTNKD